jgi:acyl-CoA thioesterase
VHELDEDTAIEAAAPGRFRGRVTDRWNIGPVPNGGYVMTIGARALAAALGAPDPLSLTAHFLAPAVPGPIDVETEVIKRGRRYATGAARLVQADREIARLLATYGDLGAPGAGPTRITGAPPAVPAPGDEAVAGSAVGQATIAQRFELRLAKETVRWLDGESGGEAEVRGAARFRDGRPLDTLAMPVLADAFPPAVFSVIAPRWVPTLELTVQVRARPAGQWVRSLFRTRFLFGGLFEEDGEIWDEAGQLVALSRQLASVPPQT